MSGAHGNFSDAGFTLMGAKTTLLVIARRREHPAVGADPDEATQIGIGICRLGCFVGAGTRSRRSPRLLAMTADDISSLCR
jgi:hypothetical protein